MSFPTVPNYSKSEINRAGQALITAGPNTKTYKEALEIVNAWRVCHAYPINTFQSTLHVKVRGFDNAIVAQRLKRLPTIIDKLQPYGARACIGRPTEIITSGLSELLS